MIRLNQAAVIAALGMLTGPAVAQSLQVSIGVRETGSVAPLGADGGTTGGIEWVDRDLNVVALDGNWHQVSFDFPTATLLAFAGATANSMYDTARGVLEHIRYRNSDGITGTIQIFLDDLRITDPTGAEFVFDWEAQAIGSEHVFQEPSFSGSTNQNLMQGSFSAVTDATAHSGMQSYESRFQFVDGMTDRWVRHQTFNTDSGPNPTVDFGGTLSFWIKGSVIPAPGSAMVMGLGALSFLRRRR